jgi:hypothetical protein
MGEEYVHIDVKCQQVKPQYNKKALEDMAIVTTEQPNTDYRQTQL